MLETILEAVVAALAVDASEVVVFVMILGIDGEAELEEWRLLPQVLVGAVGGIWVEDGIVDAIGSADDEGVAYGIDGLDGGSGWEGVEEVHVGAVFIEPMEGWGIGFCTCVGSCIGLEGDEVLVIACFVDIEEGGNAFGTAY